MSQLAIELLVVSLLCMLHLGIGMTIGTRIWRSGVPHIARQFLCPLPGDERTEVQRLLSQWFDLRLRLTEIASCARELQQMPRDLVSGWRSELEQLTNEFGQVLEDRLRASDVMTSSNTAHLVPDSQPCQINETASDSEAITNAKILELLDGQRIGFESHDESVPMVRYKFSTKQPLAVAVNNGPLAAEAFSLVQFHDLSIRDVRYFVDDLPIEDKVVIGLGVPKAVKWLAAEVEDFHSVFMYGRVGYLVTARLLASIDKRSDFPQLVH